MENKEELVSMSLYDMNKQIIAQKGPMNEQAIAASKNDCEGWALANPGKYYMLLNNELHYYTIFALKDLLDSVSAPNLVKEVYDTLPYIGTPYAIEPDPDANDTVFAFWCTFDKSGSDELHVFYLFPYDGGVIEV